MIYRSHNYSALDGLLKAEIGFQLEYGKERTAILIMRKLKRTYYKYEGALAQFKQLNGKTIITSVTSCSSYYLGYSAKGECSAQVSSQRRRSDAP